MITVIVDAHNILYRYFHGFDLGEPVDGLYYNAIKGWLKFLSSFDSKLGALLKTEGRRPQKIRMIVVFDNPDTKANAHIEEYKKGRSRPPEIKDQITVCQHMTPLLGRTTIVAPEIIEADDVIASLAQHFSKDSMVYMVTSDKDIMQCVKDSKRYVMRPLNGGKYDIMNEAKVLEKYGVTPKRIPDLLSIIGDDADNIPNVPGIGEVIGPRLLSQWGSVAGIYENIEELKGKQAENLKDHMEQVVNAYQAAKLEKWPVFEEKSPTEKYILCPPADKPNLKKLSRMLGNLGLKKLLPEIMSAY